MKTLQDELKDHLSHEDVDAGWELPVLPRASIQFDPDIAYDDPSEIPIVSNTTSRRAIHRPDVPAAEASSSSSAAPGAQPIVDADIADVPEPERAIPVLSDQVWPAELEGMPLVVIPGIVSNTHNYHARLKVKCPCAEHVNCYRSRSTKMDVNRYGHKAALIYLTAWMEHWWRDEADHRAYRPTNQEMDAIVAQQRL